VNTYVFAGSVSAYTVARPVVVEARARAAPLLLMHRAPAEVLQAQLTVASPATLEGSVTMAARLKSLDTPTLRSAGSVELTVRGAAATVMSSDTDDCTAPVFTAVAASVKTYFCPIANAATGTWMEGAVRLSSALVCSAGDAVHWKLFALLAGEMHVGSVTVTASGMNALVACTICDVAPCTVRPGAATCPTLTCAEPVVDLTPKRLTNDALTVYVRPGTVFALDSVRVVLF